MERVDDSAAVVLLITAVGLQLTAMADEKRDEATFQPAESIGFVRVLEYRALAHGLLGLMVSGPGGSESRRYKCQSTPAQDIVAVLRAQLAKRELRQQVTLSKQRQTLRAAFTQIDVSGWAAMS